MTEPREEEITNDAVPPDDLELEPPAEPDVPDLPEAPAVPEAAWPSPGYLTTEPDPTGPEYRAGE